MYRKLLMIFSLVMIQSLKRSAEIFTKNYLVPYFLGLSFTNFLITVLFGSTESGCASQLHGRLREYSCLKREYKC